MHRDRSAIRAAIVRGLALLILGWIWLASALGEDFIRTRNPADKSPQTHFQLAAYAVFDDETPESVIPPVPPAEGDKPPDEGDKSSNSDSKKSDFDPVQVAAGRAAFESHCTTCHNADKSLQKKKNYSGWLATVKRMAAKADADVPAASHTQIANYLASVAGAADADKESADAAPGAFGIGGLTPNATFAPLLLSTPDPGNNSPDFFVDAWFGADWQPAGPVRATAMVCTSCHSDFNLSKGFSLELVEASVTLDLKKAWHEFRGNRCPEESRWSLTVKGGRFVVPFGAFAGMVHPGSLRTVDNPLMFDMGRRFDVTRYQPVLPAPYSDEGINLNLSANLTDNIRATWDVYAVNGLQGNQFISWIGSRSYYDNNRSPFVGSRVTVGTKTIRFGASSMGGQTQDQTATPLYANLYGVDVVGQWNDRFRLYFEYALRNNTVNLPFLTEQTNRGLVFEAEVKICDRPRISLLGRYDNMTQQGFLYYAPTAVDRYTWGVNTTLPGGSQLILNHEHWVFSGDRSSAEVLAAKWVVSF